MHCDYILIGTILAVYLDIPLPYFPHLRSLSVNIDIPELQMASGPGRGRYLIFTIVEIMRKMEHFPLNVEDQPTLVISLASDSLANLYYFLSLDVTPELCHHLDRTLFRLSPRCRLVLRVPPIICRAYGSRAGRQHFWLTGIIRHFPELQRRGLLKMTYSDEDDGEDYILYLTIVSGLRLMLHDSRGLSSGCSR